MWKLWREGATTGTLRSDFGSDTKAVGIKDRGWPEAREA
jgi:hypothetical protein